MLRVLGQGAANIARRVRRAGRRSASAALEPPRGVAVPGTGGDRNAGKQVR